MCDSYMQYLSFLTMLPPELVQIDPRRASWKHLLSHSRRHVFMSFVDPECLKQFTIVYVSSGTVIMETGLKGRGLSLCLFLTTVFCFLSNKKRGCLHFGKSKFRGTRQESTTTGQLFGHKL